MDCGRDDLADGLRFANPFPGNPLPPGCYKELTTWQIVGNTCPPYCLATSTLRSERNYGNHRRRRRLYRPVQPVGAVAQGVSQEIGAAPAAPFAYRRIASPAPPGCPYSETFSEYGLFLCTPSWGIIRLHSVAGHSSFNDVQDERSECRAYSPNPFLSSSSPQRGASSKQ